MTEFTKGPWVPDWKNPGFLRGIDAADGNPIIAAEEYSGSSWISAENLRDIHLIAAAPELYEALEALTEMARRMDFSEGVCCCGDSVEGHGFGSGHSPVDAGLYYATDVIETARTALAKARGEA